MNKFKILFILANILNIFLVSITPADAATYYVDATAGLDSNPGTSASPFKSLAKLNSMTFLGGDIIYLKRGEVWRETLAIHSNSSATPSNPVTFDAYGTSSTNPVISGANVIPSSAWTLAGSGSIYKAKLTSSTVPTQLFVDGIPYPVARYPQSGYFTATATAPNNSSIIDTQHSFTNDQIVGANVHARVHTWSLQKQTGTAYNTGTSTISIANSFDAPMAQGYGYYLSNKSWMLTSPGAWVYDPSTQDVYLWTASSDSPATHTVEVSMRDFGVNNASQYATTIQNITVTKTNYADFYLLNSYNFTVKNSEASYSQHGFYLSLTIQGVVISNNSIHDISNDGIKAGVPNNLTITNNKVNNIQGLGINAGVSCANNPCSGIVVDGNAVTNTGGTAIAIGGVGGVVQNNLIDTACVILDDCGGVYTGSGTLNNPNSKAAQIINNEIYNVIGNINGTPSNRPLGVGVYLDDFMYECLVSNNIIHNTNLGVFIHNGHHNTITTNKFYGPGSRAAVGISEDNLAPSAGHVLNNTITNNYVSTTGTLAPMSYTSSWGTNVATFGSYNSNSYCHPNTPYIVNNNITNYTLLAWQNFSGQDLSSTEAGTGCATFPAPVVKLTASPTSIPRRGSTTLNWITRNATSCTATDNKRFHSWSGPQPLNGSVTFTNILTSITYTLTCTGTGGTAASSVTVTIN